MNVLSDSEMYEMKTLLEIINNLYPQKSPLWTINSRLNDLNDHGGDTLVLKRYFELKSKIQTLKIVDSYGTADFKLFSPSIIRVRI